MPLTTTPDQAVTPPPSVDIPDVQAWVYDGAALWGGQGIVGAGPAGGITGQNVAETAGWDATAAATLPNVPLVGNTLIALVGWSGSPTISTPAGWTAIASANNGTTIKIAAFGKTAAAGDGAFSATLSAGAGWFVSIFEVYGIVTSAQFDKTATATGTSTTVSTGTTATTAQASEIAISFLVTQLTGVSVGRGGYVGGFAAAGYSQIGNVRVFGALAGQCAYKVLTATGAQSTSATITTSAAWAGLILTVKGTTPVDRFALRGQIEACDGTVTLNPWEAGTLDLRVAESDPLAPSLRVGDIVEIRVRDPDHVCTREWYIVQHIHRESAPPLPNLRLGGLDLRSLITERTIVTATVAAQRGSPPGNKTAENWVRRWITDAAITIAAQQPYGSTQTVPGLALEVASGNRGTVYTDPPAKAGASLGDSIATVLRHDQLGWRVVLQNAGTSTAKLEVQIYTGTSRVLGQSGQVVLKRSWDTAYTVDEHDDATEAITAAVVMGPAGSTGRISYYVADEPSIQRYGLRIGVVDASNETYLDATSARKYLTERLPKHWVTVEPLIALPGCLGEDYALLTLVTAITDGGVRFDAPVSVITLQIGAAKGETGAEFGTFAPFIAALPSGVKRPPPLIAARGRGAWIELLLGDDPAVAPRGHHETDPVNMANWTYLAGLAASPTEINTLVGVSGVTAFNLNQIAGLSTSLSGLTATPTDINKLGGTTASAADFNKLPSVATGATANPRQGVQSTETTIGGQSITNATVVTDAALLADVNTAVGNLVTKLNNTIATLNALIAKNQAANIVQ